MAPAPTLHNQDRTEGNGPRLQIMRHGPRWGLVFCALFPGAGGPLGTGSGPDQAGQGASCAPAGWCSSGAVYRRKPCQIRVEGARVQNRRPLMPWV